MQKITFVLLKIIVYLFLTILVVKLVFANMFEVVQANVSFPYLLCECRFYILHHFI